MLWNSRGNNFVSTDHHLSQRELAEKLCISVGGLKYFLKALKAESIEDQADDLRKQTQ